MNGVITKDEIKIEDLIYEVRGKQVMLDSDLARLYECANGTKTINLAVKRHIHRFPERFMFQLTKEEYDILRFQLETTNNMSRSLPYVFTEQGIAMLATILRTEVAEEVSIKIMDAFVAMRKYISSNLIEQKYINDLVLEDHDKIKALETSFNKLEEKRKTNEIYFNGQIGVMLKGKMEVLTDQETKNMIWKTGDTMFYKRGVTDPDYCVLKFTATSGRYYCDLKTESFDIE